MFLVEHDLGVYPGFELGPVPDLFFKSNWQETSARAGKGFWRLLSGVSWLIAPGPQGTALVEDVREFLGGQELDGMQRPVDQAIETLGLRLAFVTRESEALGHVLEADPPPA